MMMRMKCCNDEGLQWSVSGDGHFQLCGATAPMLPAGAYSCDTDSCGRPVFMKRSLATDELMTIPGTTASDLLDEVSEFWQMGDRFHRYGFLHRRGYLFYGKQGGGKSSIIQQMVNHIVQAGNVAFFCGHPYSFKHCMLQFRKVEPNRPMICIFEDIDAIIENHGDSLLLQWLDGNHQVDKAINVASTNYPEKLDRRIIARPRRFDRIMRIDSPCETLREAYLANKVHDLSDAELAHWVEQTEGFTFAALSELIISSRCLGVPLDQAVERLRSLDSHEPSSDEFLDFKTEDDEALAS